MTPRESVGIVGVGEMGMPMVQRLLDAGTHVTFFARRPDVIEAAASRGAAAAGSIPELGGSADVLIVCVYSDDQVLDVTLGAHGLLSTMREGTTLVNHTTCSPTTVERLESEARARGVRTLDAALSGGAADVANGQLTLLVGGNRGVLDDVEAVFATYCSPILHVGAVGDGQKIKLLNNALFGANIALAAVVEERAAQLGVNPATALSAIRHCSGTSYALGLANDVGSAAQLVELAGRFVKKDVDMVERVGAELAVDLGPLVELARHAFPADAPG